MAGSVSPFAGTEQVPFEDFHLLGLLGEGGHGTVYAARHRGADVALKVLRQELALSERERSRFLDEAVRMRRVSHHALVPLLGHGLLSDGRPYLCMPRLRGETLAARLARGKVEMAQAVAIFETLAEAAAVLHAAGLIHRDIKPENVFLESPDRGTSGATPHAVLLDFGIARDVADQASTTTAAGQTRGTPAYMAPERFFGAVANVRTDVYELAVSFYAMLTGRLPWDDTQSAAARLSPMHPSDAGTDLPRELVTVLLRALSTRPEVRPSSADAFADLVRREARGTVEAPRTTASVGTRSEAAVGPPRSSTTPISLAAARPEVRPPWGRWAMGIMAAGALAALGSVTLLPHATVPSRPEAAAPKVAQEVPVAVAQTPMPPAPPVEMDVAAAPPGDREPSAGPAAAPPHPVGRVASSPRHPAPAPATSATAALPSLERAERYYRDRK